MKVVFIGASLFGEKCLRSILGMTNVDIVGVVTAPRDFSISYNKKGVTNVLHADIKKLCNDQDIPTYEIQKGMKDEDLFNTVKNWQPDIMLVAGWYHMIPKKWREMAPTYGLHASLLPDYSGGAPLVWALINGEKETGITFFQFDAGVDSGPIVGQKKTLIYQDDDIASLYQRIENLGVELLVTYLPQIANDSVELIYQDEAKRRVFPQRKPDDGKIDFSQSAEKIYDFIRAQTKPYPGAFFHFNDKKITIWSSSKKHSENFKDIEGGQLVSKENRLFLGCANSTCIEIIDLAVDEQDSNVEYITNTFYGDLKENAIR